MASDPCQRLPEPDLAREHAALTHDLSGCMTDDREGYSAAKTAFILRVEATP